ncbi:alcohol dehydrogenase catalytic domain-containing protein [Bifidobacterium sp. SMB2]|uniref:Alcohol dehydrogenase catalytic domain-containing protein n=1 Tax=Bifidobacterium saimiriisciurei TaxID=2661627 RepID=A0ABX0CAU2_9BIFI|nr:MULTISPECIES: zinc-binding dehydrogenase [Bifidobacterium]NEG96219.1 alcohol dehydrogenase catalytic domain-containing protein [Bifidobacterium sp. SMB2]NEH12232.1 alcohol dehydrogenase catalytic domain-containing protein [Bifidobacterium saimiriisciurei]
MEGMMKGAYLPGNSTVDLREIPIPKPGYGQVLVKMKASTICGSDIRAIYREHTGKGPEGYQNKVAGHEPCGQVVEEGPGVQKFKTGSRVIVYHIHGCGLCHDCRMGYQISCSSEQRAAYGWQRDGGMEEYVVCDERDLVALPDELTYTDGAQVACGFGTAYEAIEKIGVSGNHALLVTGLGPVGLATLMLCKSLGAKQLIGVESNPYRIELAKKLGLADVVLEPSENNVQEVLDLTGGHGVERAIDTSGADAARATAVRATRAWGRIAFVGEGGTVHFNPSPDMLHGQKTIYGSWVTSVARMETLVENLVAWGIHPEDLVTDRFSIDDASKAYELMASGKCGKVAVCFDEELK